MACKALKPYQHSMHSMIGSRSLSSQDLQFTSSLGLGGLKKQLWMPEKLRILTWNVRGLSRLRKRNLQSVAELLESMHADVLCLQETQLPLIDFHHQELPLEFPEDVPGWQSFYSLCTMCGQYSGVATFVRESAVHTYAAESGLMGDPESGLCSEAAAAALASLDQRDMLDNEDQGRAVVTDHGAFVLFNVYLHACSNLDEAVRAAQYRRKLTMCKALEARVRALQSEGRHVIICGDMNTGSWELQFLLAEQEEASLQEAEASFPDFAWFTRFTRPPKGLATDVLLHFYEGLEKRKLFTCWPFCEELWVRSKEEGKRPDFILTIAPKGRSSSGHRRQLEVGDLVVTKAASQRHVLGSDHCPLYIEMDLSGAAVHEACHSILAVPNLETRIRFKGWRRRYTSERTGYKRKNHFLDSPSPPRSPIGGQTCTGQ